MQNLNLVEYMKNSSLSKNHSQPFSTCIEEFVFNMSPTTPYSFTLRKCSNADKSTEKDYHCKLDKFKAMGIQITDHVFENNHTNKGVHCHGIMQIPKKFNMKRLQTRGWHICLNEIYDKSGWDAYMAKEQILALNDNVSDDFNAYSDSPFTMPKHKLF